MHEKELRLALVCYGGVSLAIYMSGVTKEVLKVLRASRAYHSVIDPGKRRAITYDDVADTAAYETDTERLYFELLQSFAPKLELRVVVDIISGASAGGINGILLARAIAHDLSLDSHRKMWLQRADVTQLMEPDTIADKWSKFYLYPFFWAMNVRRLRVLVPNPETRRKLSIFVRSRWFKPPFSGDHMMNFMLDAVGEMDRREPSESSGESSGREKAARSLIPPGLSLDLFVSLTNFYGRHQEIQLHDPESIIEREHRTSLTFSSNHRQAGLNLSDFDDDNVPGLAFAARATSSFPGAFPPAQLGDLDAVLKDRGENWPGRERFMRQNFPPSANQIDASVASSKDPGTLSFIDGAVVNNKPFAAAIDALADRSAQREVDRRIVYIDPVPEDLSIDENEASPGFFRAILASLSEIPRNEPINDELNWVNGHNRQSNRLQNVITSVKSEVDAIIDDLIVEGQHDKPGVALVASWREKINRVSKDRAGYAYTSYSHTKTYAVFDRLAQLLCELCTTLGYAIPISALVDALYVWGNENEILAGLDGDEDTIVPASQTSIKVHSLIGFLRDFDVDFRMRRLRFVISGLNDIYQSDAARRNEAFDPHQLNAMKREIYVFIDQLRDRWHSETYVENARADIARLGNAMETGENGETGETSEIQGALSTLMQRLGALMELQDRDFDYDQTMSEQIGAIEDPRVRQELFRAYIGFPFFDVLTLPLLQSMDLSELEPIRVDRISPEDCNAIRSGGAEKILKGIGFARFAAFFSRADRENDYLWGRLNSAERLVDFIINSARLSDVSIDFDIMGFKKRLFLSILEAERPFLKTSATLFEDLRLEIMAIA
jgi:patatin-related protein